MKVIKKIFIVALLVIMSYQVLNHVKGDDTSYNMTSRNYYVEKGYAETSSKNLVTAIYLDYRMFDSFFEASILLVAVTGIAFMAIKDEDML